MSVGDEAAAQLLGDLLAISEAFVQSRLLLQRASDVVEDALRSGNATIARALPPLAGRLASAGRLDEAAALCRQALIVTSQVAGEGDPNVVSTMHDLALLYDAGGQREEAQSLWAEARSVLQ
jgi:hypothetical protein